MPTEREMVEVITRDILGWKAEILERGATFEFRFDNHDQWSAPWNPFNTLDAAFMVAEKIAENVDADLFVDILEGFGDDQGYPSYRGRFGLWFLLKCDDRPRAISLAAYKWAISRQPPRNAATNPARDGMVSAPSEGDSRG